MHNNTKVQIVSMQQSTLYDVPADGICRPETTSNVNIDYQA